MYSAEEKIKEINEKIRESIDSISNKKRYEKLLNSAKNELGEIRNKVNELEEQLAKEEKDVEKYSKITFANLFHTILNDKSEKIDKEQREVLEAKLKCEMAETQLQECKNNIEKLENNYYTYLSAEQDYETLIKQKREIIEQYLPEKWQEIEQYLEEDKLLSCEEKEISEAIHAGNRVISQLQQVQESLKSAQNWGTWDMLGGGMLSTMAKREKMQEAQSYISRTQSLLGDFSRELGDIETYINIDLDIDSFLGFADYFFDGFFVDWAVQSKINSAIDKVNSVYNQVEHIMSSLESNYSQVNNRRNQIQRDIEMIVEKI
jgi:DNA repair exonuclease SbcCD ATPase subunit